MCGKNSPRLCQLQGLLGSPPRVREKHRQNSTDKLNLGITPACAGKTKSIGLSANIRRDHPRVCGKNYSNSGDVYQIVGSPPRVREKPKRENQLVVATVDHPRVCGKNNFSFKVNNVIPGSPPRVREKL